MYSTEEGAHTKLQLHGNRVDPATTASQPPRRGPLPCVFQGMHFVNFSSQPVHQFVESYIVDQPTSPDSLPHDWLEPPRPWQLQRQAVAIADSTAQSRAETWTKLPQPLQDLRFHPGYLRLGQFVRSACLFSSSASAKHGNHGSRLAHIIVRSHRPWPCLQLTWYSKLYPTYLHTPGWLAATSQCCGLLVQFVLLIYGVTYTSFSQPDTWV